MAEFTMQLSELVNTWGLDINGLSLSAYPIFDETYRAGLNDKIIRHYWYREIGQESPDVFLYNLFSLMNEIMPFYNQVYESTLIKFDPLSTYKLSEVTESDQSMKDNRTVNQNANTTSNSDNSTRATTFEGPSVQVSDTGDYGTAKTVSESSTTGTGVSDSVENAAGSADATGTSRHDVGGRIGDSAELLRSYRAALINVDMMVVRAVAPAFFGVWNLGDSTIRKANNYGYVYPIGLVFGQ